MKKYIFGGLFILLGLLTAIGPQLLFAVCPVHGDQVMKCFWTARAEIGAGAVTAISGLLIILIRSAGTRLGIYFSLILNGTLSLLIPTILIGVDDDPMMSCHTYTLPVLVVASAAVIAAALAGVLYTIHSGYKGRKQYET